MGLAKDAAHQTVFNHNYRNIVICFQIAYGIGLLTAGRLIDKLGTKLGYALAIGVCALSSMGHAFVFSVAGFCIARFMLGLGETWDEIIQVMHDMREHEVDILTIGQYLRPSLQHLPIQRYVPLEEFAALKAEGKQMGFRHVESGPFVRSSYHAHEQADGATREQTND